MTSYKDFRKQEIVDTGFSSGGVVTQQAYQNIDEDDVVVMTHDEDADSSRIVQIVELISSSESTTDTSLDFDQSDETDFIQENSINGTDFIDGKILLHGVVGGSVQQQKLFAQDVGDGDEFGWSVSIYGDTAIVGAYKEDEGGSDAGAAYIFTRTGTDWSQQAKLTASDAQSDDNFGSSVAIYGDTAIVGAYKEDTGTTGAGAAYIFTRSGTTWSQQQKIQAANPYDNDEFGGAVSIYGDTVVVGSARSDTGGTNTGAVYVFTVSGTTWSQQEKLLASDAQSHDLFGYSVSIYGDTVIVGAYKEDEGGSDAGAAYIFTRTGTDWSQQQKLKASDAATYDSFGNSVSIYGDIAIVGASFEDTVAGSAGAVYIFTRTGTTWTEKQKIQASDAQSADYFGHSVSIHGDTLIAGAYGEDDGGSAAGAAYLFTVSGTTWVQQQKLIASDAEAEDEFGWSVSIYGDTVIVGAHLEHPSAANAGSAYIFSTTSMVYPTNPYYVTTSNENHLLLSEVFQVNSCSVTNTLPADTSIKCLISFDNRSTWEKWGGSSWAAHSGGLTNLQTGNTIAELETGFTNLTIVSGTEYLDFAFDLGTTDNEVTPEIDLITVNYSEHGYYRIVTNNYNVDYLDTTNTRVVKNSVGAKNVKVNVLI